MKVALILLLVLLAGCASPLHAAVTIADTGATIGEAAAGPLAEHCAAPMAVASKAGDVETAKKIAARCDGPMVAYESLRVAHIALRGLILELHAGHPVMAALVAQIPVVVAAGSTLAKAIEQMIAGASR